METQQKTAEQQEAEKRKKAQDVGSAIGTFDMKLDVIASDVTIEEQLSLLSKYNDNPTIEQVKNGNNNNIPYRMAFMESLYKKYFEDYPMMLDMLGDKKTDDNLTNFYTLRLLNELYSSNFDDDSNKQVVKEYYNILSKYETYLVQYIVENQKWELTKNPKESFIVYADILKSNNAIADKYNLPFDISLMIRDVRNELVDKIVEMRKIGIDDETFRRAVNDVVVGKYVGFTSVMNLFAGGGASVMGLSTQVIFDKYPLKEIYNSIIEVENKLELNEWQKKQLTDAKDLIEALRKNGYGGSKSGGLGCMIVLLVLLIPASLLAVII